MSTYSSDQELGELRVLDSLGQPLGFVDVASSYIENDVRLYLGDHCFFMDPPAAAELAAALTRQARRADLYQSEGG